VEVRTGVVMQKVGFNPSVMFAYDFLRSQMDDVLKRPLFEGDFGKFPAFCAVLLNSNLSLPCARLLQMSPFVFASVLEWTDCWKLMAEILEF
jgi:hypothetical protein